MDTGTRTNTYTVTDVRRMVASFGADFWMIAQATGLRESQDVGDTVSDLTVFAEVGYLEEVNLILWDAAGNKIRAAKYTVSTSAVGWNNDRPGDNLWPRTAGGQLQVVATMSSEWTAMDEDAQAATRERLGLINAWGPTSVDTSHVGMNQDADRRYASNAYGLARIIYT